MNTSKHRRDFLRYVAGSALIYSSPEIMSLSRVFNSDAQANAIYDEILDHIDALIESADAAVNVFEFAPVAKQKLSPAHWTYIDTGVDNGNTLLANREGFKKFYLRSRRLVDVSNIDMSIEILGEKLDSPIIVSPTGGQGGWHPMGDVETARGARAANHLMMHSSAASFSLEDVIEARGEPVWFQLYPTNDWNTTKAIVKRAENAGCRVMALTVDVPDRNTERVTRFRRGTNPECQACHGGKSVFSKPLYAGLDVPTGTNFTNPGMTWDYVRRLQDMTDMKLLIKGISTAEDAALCVENGLDGLVLSNHGGRGDESGRSTIETLPEVVDAVQGRIPILIDGGFRRGTDAVKALALGADAVCIGRPYLWGLGAFGKEGVERVLNILDRELRIAMQQAGTPTIKDITSDFVKAF
jgi:isopentenyl diphosphate isomerase/L-lactate dehydrogenase-like FMN-dependent dehydrogenase